MTYLWISNSLYKLSNHLLILQSNSKLSRTTHMPKGSSMAPTSRPKKQMMCIEIWLQRHRWVGVKQMICWWTKRVVEIHRKFIRLHSTIWKECMLIKILCLKLRECLRPMMKVEFFSIVKIKLMPMKKVERQAFPHPYSLGNIYHFSNDNY